MEIVGYVMNPQLKLRVSTEEIIMRRSRGNSARLGDEGKEGNFMITISELVICTILGMFTGWLLGLIVAAI